MTALKDNGHEYDNNDPDNDIDDRNGKYNDHDHCHDPNMT